MPKAYTFRTLVKALKRHDRRFEININRAKGSERMIYHPDINGSPVSYPVKCHGENTSIGKGTLSAIKRRFSIRDL